MYNYKPTNTDRKTCLDTAMVRHQHDTRKKEIAPQHLGNISQIVRALNYQETCSSLMEANKEIIPMNFIGRYLREPEAIIKVLDDLSQYYAANDREALMSSSLTFPPNFFPSTYVLEGVINFLGRYDRKGYLQLIHEDASKYTESEFQALKYEAIRHHIKLTFNTGFKEFLCKLATEAYSEGIADIPHRNDLGNIVRNIASLGDPLLRSEIASLVEYHEHRRYTERHEALPTT